MMISDDPHGLFRQLKTLAAQQVTTVDIMRKACNLVDGEVSELVREQNNILADFTKQLLTIIKEYYVEEE